VAPPTILKAISATNFPTAPAACRLPEAAIQSSTQDQSNLLKPGKPPTNLLGIASEQEGATQLLLFYPNNAAAEQAAAQITSSIEACAKALHTTTGTNGGARGKLADPSGVSLGLAAQLAQGEPQCIDVYVISRCTTKLAQPLTASIALESTAVVTTALPGAGATAGGYTQDDSVYLVQHGTVVTMLFVDAQVAWETPAADPTRVLQDMLQAFSGAGGQ
jgi:hypothetical protein